MSPCCTSTRTARLRPPCLYTYNATPKLHASMPPRPYVRSAPPELHTSATSLHLQRGPRSPYPHIATPAARRQTSYLHTFHVPTPTARLHASRPPYLHASTVPRPPRVSRAIELLPPRVHAYTATQISTPPCLHVTTPVARLRSSMLPYLYIPMSVHLQRTSRAPWLRVATSAYASKTSRSPYLYTSMSLYLQRASRQSIPPRLCVVTPTRRPNC